MAFIDDVRKPNLNVATLIDVSLTQPTARTLYLTDRAGTYGATVYEERVTDWGTSAQSCNLTTGEVKPLTGSFTVQNRKLNYQAAGKAFGDILSTYVFPGATVEIKLWNINTGTSATRFKGYIQNVDSYDGDEITFNLSEAEKWDAVIPPTVIEPDAFPEAPEGNFGKRVGLCYGSFHYTETGGTYPAGLRGAVMPALCIDKNGPDHGRPLVRVCQNDGTTAAHTIVTHGMLFYDSTVGELVDLNELTYGTPVNDANKVEAEFSADPYGWVLMFPIGIGTGDTSTDPGKAMDKNSSTYAQITDAEILSLTLPSWSNLGNIIEIKCYIYLNNTDASGDIVYGLWDEVNDVYYQSDTYPATGTQDAFVVSTLEAPWRDWRFIEDSGATDAPVELRCELDSDTGHAKIKAILLEIEFYLSKDMRAVPGPTTPITRKMQALKRSWNR